MKYSTIYHISSKTVCILIAFKIFFMCNNKLILSEREFIPRIYDSVIPYYYCQKNEFIVNFTTDDITSRFQLFSKIKIIHVYITESMQIC